MAGSTLDPDNIPARRKPHTQKGHDVASLGPSDTSDSGSDMQGPGAGRAVGDRDMDDTSDSHGTGEHLTAGTDPLIRPNEDRDVDRVVDANEAGLGRGLDEAEKARQDPKKPKR